MASSVVSAVDFMEPYVLTVPVPNSDSKGCTSVLRASTHPDALVDNFVDHKVGNCWELFQAGLKLSRDAPFLGRRAVVPRSVTANLNAAGPEVQYGDYEWITYREGEKAALSIGSALFKGSYVPVRQFPEEQHVEARNLRLLGMYCKNCIEWFICEQAANAFGLTLVPLYDTLGQDSVQYILELTELSTVVTSHEGLKHLIQAKRNCPDAVKLENIIFIEESDTPAALIEEATALGMKTTLWVDLLKLGRKNRLQDSLEGISPSWNSVSTLCFTSGTTGKPKGVIMTHGNIVSCVIAALRGPLSGAELRVTPEETHLSYLPLAHSFERIICNMCMARGGKIGVFSGNTLRLMEDLRALKPTVFISVPRLYHRINDKININLQEKSAVAKKMFTVALKQKLVNLRKYQKFTHPVWDMLIFNKFRQLLGGRIRKMVVGGAAMDAEVEDRMKVFFCCPVVEGYGMTETMGASFNSPARMASGNVGAPLPCIEVKLRSVPEMNYYVTDTPPRGELLMRGHSVTPGYFRNVKETSQVLAADGWLSSGDIVVLLPTGAVKIIDRRKAIFKLSQGEYVSPEHVESAYLHAPLVGQIFVFGYPTKPSLVALVVPDTDACEVWARRNGISSSVDLEKLCLQSEFKQDLLQDMERAGKSLKGFEKAKKVHLVPFAFTPENGLLTPTFKMKRHDIKLRFQSEIDEMYKQLDCEAIPQPLK